MVQLLWGRLRNQTVYGEQPLLPTAVTFTVLMRALTEQPDRRQQARDVLAVYDEAGRLGRRLDYSVVNENTFKHALRACDLLGWGDRALEILQEMRANDVKADVLIYANAMNACAKNGQVQTVMRLLAEMRTDGLAPNAFCFNAAVSACCRAGRTRQAL